MIIYEATKKEFLEHVSSGIISKEIVKNIEGKK
jgi:hypothetical protein